MTAMTNRDIVNKADLALSELTSSGGVLVPEQAQRFIRLLIEEAVMLKKSTVQPMRAPKARIEKFAFGSRILRVATDSQALSLSDRVKPTLSRVELSTTEFKAEVHLSNAELEDSIEQQRLRDTVMEMMAERIAADMDEVIVQGDTTSLDPFLAAFNGVLATISSHTVDAGGASLDKTVLKAMIKAMPHQYRRDKRNLAYMTSMNAEVDYRDSLASRATPGGDKFALEDADVFAYGIPLYAVPMFPETLGGGQNTTDVVLTNPKNVTVGIQRQITFETDKDISAGVLKVVGTVRFDMKIQEETAAVKATNVAVS